MVMAMEHWDLIIIGAGPAGLTAGLYGARSGLKTLVLEEKMPGVAEYMEKDSPGMHTTDTIDLEYILSGEVWLELDDGKEVHLQAGDTVIQNGTRHAWYNRGSEPCSIIVCLIGAKRT